MSRAKHAAIIYTCLMPYHFMLAMFRWDFQPPVTSRPGSIDCPRSPSPHHPDHTHPDRAFEGRSEVPPSRIRAAQGLQLQVLLLGAFLLTRRDRPAYRFGPENGRAGCHVAELNGVSLTWQLMVDMTYPFGYDLFVYPLNMEGQGLSLK